VKSHHFRVASYYFDHRYSFERNSVRGAMINVKWSLPFGVPSCESIKASQTATPWYSRKRIYSMKVKPSSN